MTAPQLAIRIQGGNPDHHLWNNNGTWFVHYTVYPTPHTSERFRVSLGTRNVATARRKRDRLFLAFREGVPPVAEHCRSRKTREDDK